MLLVITPLFLELSRHLPPATVQKFPKECWPTLACCLKGKNYGGTKTTRKIIHSGRTTTELPEYEELLKKKNCQQNRHNIQDYYMTSSLPSSPPRTPLKWKTSALHLRQCALRPSEGQGRQWQWMSNFSRCNFLGNWTSFFPRLVSPEDCVCCFLPRERDWRGLCAHRNFSRNTSYP